MFVVVVSATLVSPVSTTMLVVVVAVTIVIVQIVVQIVGVAFFVDSRAVLR